MEDFSGVAKVVFGLGACVGFLLLILKAKYDELFHNAIHGLARQSSEITVSMIIDLYLGSCEKTLDNLTKSDLKKIEKALLRSFATLSAEQDDSKRPSIEALSRLQLIADELRQYQLPN